jgi:hypothetical protein
MKGFVMSNDKPKGLRIKVPTSRGKLLATASGVQTDR